MQTLVARAAQAEQLHRVRQAFAGFRHCFKKRSFGQHTLGKLDHIAADKQAGSRATVKLLCNPVELRKRIRADIHGYSVVLSAVCGR